MAEVILPFQPRVWQRRLIEDPAEQIVAVVHRRAGKSTGLVWRGFKRVLSVERALPRVVYLLPFLVQWERTGLWDVVKTAARSIPYATIRESDKQIRFAGGGVFQAGGTDNPDAWRGGYADEAILDEFEDMPPSVVPLVIMPMLSDRKGTLVLSGTPKGRGMLRQKFHEAAARVGWSRYLLTYRETGALSEEAITRLRNELTPQQFAQEMECDFTAPGSQQFIGPEAVDGAIEREPFGLMSDAMVLGVDVARFGDDLSVIYTRKGRDGRTHPPIKLRGVDTMQLSARVAEHASHVHADAVFVDGGGVGGGVVDRLRQLNVPVFEVQFGAKPDRAFLAEGSNPDRYANKRAEMWGVMREWLSRGAIPDDPDLRIELVAVQYGFTIDNAILLEKKEDMKKRGMKSPDVADALALTFAYPVQPTPRAGRIGPMENRVQHEYNPYETEPVAPAGW